MKEMKARLESLSPDAPTHGTKAQLYARLQEAERRKTLQEEMDIDMDMGVGHGATIESVIGSSSSAVRKARIHAGLPTIL